ncbi:hypothetical protein E4U14_000379 [Claviceps sp. LM454 group G7]|nr:hypothetical protein E4U14_000379 [Claviceps sp. LM454 group G7]
MGPEFRPEWPRPEESRPGDVSHLVDATIQNLKDMTNLAEDKTLYNKLSSASFRDKLTNFLGEQCGAGEASSPSGPTTDEINTDAESVASVSILTTRSRSTGDRRQVSAGTDVGGEEEELPSFVDAPDPSLVFGEATAKAEEQTALSMPSTAGIESTQKEAPDRHRQAQPPFSPQSSCSGPGLPPSGQLAMKMTRSRTTKKNRKSCEKQDPEDWRPGLRASHTKPTAAHRPSAANLLSTSWDLTSSPNAGVSGNSKRGRKSGTLCWFRA